MAYTKVNFTDGTTPLNATNLGKLDDALSDQDARIDGLTLNVDSISEFISQMNSVAAFVPTSFFGTANFMQELASVNAYAVGIAFRTTSNNYDFFASVNQGRYFYGGRIDSTGSITHLSSFTGATVS